MGEVTASRAANRDLAWLRPWLVAGLALWLAVAVTLVDWAQRRGLVADISFSPYHLFGYAALLVLAAYVGFRFFRNVRRTGWRDVLPAGYGGLGLGFVLIAAWVLLDILWRNTLGIGFGIENGLAPPRLLLPAAFVVIAAGPVREALAVRATRPGSSQDRRTRWAGVVGTAVIGGVLTLTAFNPLRDARQDWRVEPGRDLSELWSMAADGSDQRRLIAAVGDGVDYSLPTFSPDGARIAYTVWTNERGLAANLRPDDQTSSIWTAAANGSDRRPLVDGAPGQAWIPAWSPTGEWISYTVAPGDTPQSAAQGGPQPNNAPGAVGRPAARGHGSIWIVRPDGTDARQVTGDGESAVAAAWSPDGTMIAFESRDVGTSDIHVARVTAEGLADERVIAPNGSDDWGPSWSPDGASIAFVSNREGSDDVWIAAADGTGEPRRLTDDPASDWVPQFSPDGSRIAFVSDRTGDLEVWTMAPDGSDLRNLSQHGNTTDGEWSVAWSPDGSHIVYAVSPLPSPWSSGPVRFDFAAAETLLFAIVLALVAILLGALAAPFGSFTVALVLIVGLSVAATERWEYLPAALVGGVLVDLLVRWIRPARRTEAAAAALPAVAVFGLGLTLGVGSTLTWSITLLLGITMAAALIGWSLAYAVERLFQLPGEGVLLVEREG